MGGHPSWIKKGNMPGKGIDTKALTDVAERGAPKEEGDEPQKLNKRLFIQLLAFGECKDTAPLVKALSEASFFSVLYADVNDPRGVGLLTMSEDPGFFTEGLRDFLNKTPFSELCLKHDYTMLGRTYAIGHERDLEDWLLTRPPRVAGNPQWPWAVWYPIRRTGEYALLSPKEQGMILMEHAQIGRAFGEADLGHDIRLTSYGLDKNDNDFVVALIGKELHPLSVLVQAMRKTKQTSTYIEKMGPFFIGRAIWHGK
jgi:chlorite dismutase